MSNRVEHPSYYQGENGIETIEIIRHYTCDIANALKYLMRAGKKSERGMDDAEKEIEDLKKAIFYIEDYKDNLKPTMQKLTQTATMAKRIKQTTGHDLQEITKGYEDNVAAALGCLLTNGLVWNGKELCHDLWLSDLDAAKRFIQNRILDINAQLVSKDCDDIKAIMAGYGIEGSDYVSKPGCVRETEPEKYDPLNMIIAYGRAYSLTDEIRKKANGALYSPCDNCDMQEFCFDDWRHSDTSACHDLCRLHQAEANQWYKEVGTAKYSPSFGTVEVVDPMKEQELEMKRLEEEDDDELMDI